MQISAVIIAFNEENYIADAIRSVAWADEVLVIDSESTDKTREIAESLGAKVLINKWEGFSKQKQLSFDKAQNDWVFSLDADERVSTELKEEILKLKSQSSNDLANGYKIPRLSIYMNRPIRHSGWYPDWQLRFVDRTKGKWTKALVHESFQMIEGSQIKKLKNNIIHHTVENAAHHHKMIGERYAPLAAREMLRNGKRTSKFKIFSVGFTTFIHTFIIKAGFLDGFPGFCIAKFAAQNSFLKHLILWELQNNESNTDKN